MPLSFHTRLTDTQVAAIDAATQITDPRTGLTLTVSRQEVVSSILDAWIAQHAPPAEDVALLDRLLHDDAPLLDALVDDDAPRLDALLASTPVVEPETALADIGPPPSADAPGPPGASPPGSMYPVPTADPSPPDALPDAVHGKAALAARVRALRLTLSHSKIAAMLNAEGVPTLGTKPGAKWSNSSVERLKKFRG